MVMQELEDLDHRFGHRRFVVYIHPNSKKREHIIKRHMALLGAPSRAKTTCSSFIADELELEVPYQTIITPHDPEGYMSSEYKDSILKLEGIDPDAIPEHPYNHYRLTPSEVWELFYKPQGKRPLTDEEASWLGFDSYENPRH